MRQLWLLLCAWTCQAVPMRCWALGKATIALVGPADVWFGMGFNVASMADTPYRPSLSRQESALEPCGPLNRYTIVVDGTGAVSEHTLGNHMPGTPLAPSVRPRPPALLFSGARPSLPPLSSAPDA